MAKLKYYDIIIRPVVTEMSMADMSNKKYIFLVHKDANKIQIKEAVEKMFDGTRVEKVNTINKQGKIRRRGMIIGKTNDNKKAIVMLKSDSKEIELFSSLSSN